uniref:Alternative protein RNFT2 n=1 Tax=Homo sapiens TaxID=9606 RepID=L8EAK7_HUMAN|nr:alternative protein RNFT2 [Homo sapiens]
MRSVSNTGYMNSPIPVRKQPGVPVGKEQCHSLLCILVLQLICCK